MTKQLLAEFRLSSFAIESGFGFGHSGFNHAEWPR